MPIASRLPDGRRAGGWRRTAALAVGMGLALAGCGRRISVLFIGNSYTHWHDMPVLVAALSEAAGHAPRIDTAMVTVGGASLGVLHDRPLVRGKFASRRWTYVVLQEQSLLPLENRSAMFEAAKAFDGEIKASGARTVLYSTWARLEQPEAQEELNSAYRDLGRELDGIVAPVGEAWRRALEGRPGLRLHEDDGSHPNATGAYLTACVFYSVLSGRSGEGLPGRVPGWAETSPPNDETAHALQRVAWETVQKEAP